MRRPALFLDRDGVINVDHGYVYRPDDFDFIDGIFELVAAANSVGYLVVVVTNQAGIGRGYYSESDFHELMGWVRQRFSMRGAYIDAVYFCPFHPEYGVGEYRRESDCRKPAPGMLLQAERDLGIDLGGSIFIGDKCSDMLAGFAAGVGCLLHFNSEPYDGPGVSIRQLVEAMPYLRAPAN